MSLQSERIQLLMQRLSLTEMVHGGVALILDIDLKLRGQPSVADEVSIL